MKEKISISIEQGLIERIRTEGNLQNRTVSNMIEFMAEHYLEDIKDQGKP